VRQSMDICDVIFLV